MNFVIMKNLAIMCLMLLYSSSIYASRCPAVSLETGAEKAVPVGEPVDLVALGFTSSGILPGSFGSSMMSVADKASGGREAARRLIATLQSAGTAGTRSVVLAVVQESGTDVRHCPAVSLEKRAGKAVPIGEPVDLVALGFTSTGISRGSFGASMMSVIDKDNRGGEAARRLIATLQSAGTAGTHSVVLAVQGASKNQPVHDAL